MPSTTQQTFVQAKASASAGAGNVSLTYNSNVTQGNLLIAAASYQASLGTPTISDTQSNIWTEVGQVQSFLSGTGLNLILFYALAGATGSNQVTLNVSGVSGVSNVWLAVAEFSGANSLAIFSGSSLGYGLNPPYIGPQSSIIQAVNPPLTTPQGALLIAAATTNLGTATWSIDQQNNYLSIAAQGGGIVLAYGLNMFAGAPFCDMNPPEPILDRSGDASVQWVIVTAPFTTTILPPTFPTTNANTFEPAPFPQFPEYPYTANTQESSI